MLLGSSPPGPYAPFGQADDVPGLDEAADLVPDGDGDAARLVGHLARPHLVPVLRLGDSPCGGEAQPGWERGWEAAQPPGTTAGPQARP